MLRKWTGVRHWHEVVKKNNKIVEEMLTLIAKYTASNGKVSCGIVYCFSQADCEKMADKLTLRAGMDKRFPKARGACTSPPYPPFLLT